jgi:cytoskeletal protein CcmA (bactofilin family)
MAGYSARQSSFTTGDTILAAHSNDEFNQVLAAFNATTGHSHDGTAGEGGPVGVLRDADSNNKVLVDTSNNHLEFYVEVSSAAVQQLRIQDGAIVPITDSDIDLGTSSLEFKDLFIDGTANIDALVADTADINGGTVDGATLGTNSAITQAVIDNININGATIGHTSDTDLLTLADGVLTVAGEVSVTTLDIGGTNVTSTAAELNIVDGDTSATSTTVADADRVVLNDNGSMVQVAVTDLAAYFDDEITAMPNLTSVGTLTTLTVDNVIINGSNIGHTGDTDLLTVASGILTVAGEVSMTTLDIGGTNVTSTATELNLLDGITAGTVSASLAVIADSNKDISGFRNVTLTGELDAGSLDISGDADIDGTLEADAITVNGATLTEFITDAVGGMVSSNTETGITVTFEDSDNTLDFALGSSQTTISSLTNTSLVIGRDADNDIDFATDNTILFRADGADQIKLVNGALAPVTDNDIDLGTSSLEFKDGFFDGTVTADAFAGPLTGDVTGNVSGTAATVTGAAQSNITSLGTLTTLTVDNVIINGTTIGHTDDTDLITLADGIATVAGEVSLTTLDIGGTNVTATAAELNLLDGGTSVGSSLTLADADGIIMNDGGTMKSMPASDIKTYVGAGAGAFSIANLDIDGGTDIGEAIVDADLFIVDNGAGGTNRKVAASRLVTYVDANSSAASVGKAIAMAIVFG